MFKSKGFKNCIALFLITLIAGVSLAVVNSVTVSPIAKAEDEAKKAAYNQVFENAEFEELQDTEILLKTANDELSSSEYSSATVDDALVAKDSSGNVLGYVMTATSSSGYGGDVKIAIGISSATDEITGFTVLSNNETAGLGAKCTEEEFQSQFAGKSAKGITFTKTGATTDTEIDAISGATITTTAVTEAVNASLFVYNQCLKEG